MALFKLPTQDTMLEDILVSLGWSEKNIQTNKHKYVHLYGNVGELFTFKIMDIDKFVSIAGQTVFKILESPYVLIIAHNSELSFYITFKCCKSTQSKIIESQAAEIEHLRAKLNSFESSSSWSNYPIWKNSSIWN